MKTKFSYKFTNIKTTLRYTIILVFLILTTKCLLVSMMYYCIHKIKHFSSSLEVQGSSHKNS